MYNRHYEEIESAHWSMTSPNIKECICHGGGWWVTDFDSWEKCRWHYRRGMRHPEDYDDLPLDEWLMMDDYSLEPTFDTVVVSNHD